LVKGIHHTGISVTDLGKAIKFYTQAGGFELAHQFSLPNTAINRDVMEAANSGANVAWLKSPTSYLELLQFDRPTNTNALPPAVNDPGIRHICLQAKDGNELFDLAVSHGASWHARPAGLGTGNLYVYVRDPMNNVVELEGLPPVPKEGAPIWYGHTAYVVQNMQPMLEFYEALTGLKRNREGTFNPGEPFDTVTGLKGTHLQAGWIPVANGNLEFWHYLAPQSSRRSGAQATDLGFTHTCFEVDDVVSSMRDLTNVGVHFLSEAIVGDSNTVVFGRDPENNLFELISFNGQGESFSLDTLSGGRHPHDLAKPATNQ
jgi:catechol 2,3-dioxygenase-like lactoylglutathione lyase family enzyme